MIDLADNRDWYAKTNNPTSVLEFDACNMVVPHDRNSGSRWTVKARVELFNSSAMNSIENELAQIGSKLLDQLRAPVHARIRCSEWTQWKPRLPKQFHCNIMYWVVLPSLGARVYQVKESHGEDRDVTYVPMVQDPELSRLDNELHLSNDEIPTVAS
ncbi:hypothetical protein ACER0C_003008 [Sarotherodon galilaeus]